MYSAKILQLGTAAAGRSQPSYLYLVRRIIGIKHPTVKAMAANTMDTTATSGTNMMADETALCPPTTIPSIAHTMRQVATPARNEDMPDLFRYPETSDTSTPRIPPTGVLEAITAVAVKAPKAIRPDANGDSNFRRFIMRFFCNSNGRCWPASDHRLSLNYGECLSPVRVQRPPDRFNILFVLMFRNNLRIPVQV